MMKSVKSFQTTRKAHSATKIRDERISSYDFKNKNKISCASASYYSSREKIRDIRDPKNIFHGETLTHAISIDSYKKKLFLNASQILSKLQKISSSCEDSHKSLTADETNQIHCAKRLELSFKKLNFHYDLLKRLLEKRCVLILKEESRYTIKQTQKLVSDLKHYFGNEIIKLTTMPVKSYNRFIDSSDTSFSVLEQLFIKVNSICDLHSSLKNNYQNIINFFHVGFDMDLNQMLIKLNKFLNNLYSEVFFWTGKVLEVFILRLCLADPDSVSPELLHQVLEICESFNLIFFDKKPNYAHLTNTFDDLLDSYMHLDYEAVLLNFILKYLSHFEAKVAAEKIIHYLIHECKNYSYSTCNEYYNGGGKIENVSSNTSDYYSVSPTVAEVNVHNLSTDTFSFENVFLSVIQRNQSLILKYLYSIICLDVSMPTRRREDAFEKLSDSSTVNKAWNLPHSGCKSKSYLCLEEKYWICFWEKVFSFCLKLVLEVPCHQYGNAAAGVFLFWPHSYHNVIFKLLKSSAESKDISSHGSNVLKKLLHYLLVFTTEGCWDKNMSCALSMIHKQQCMPIPVAENRARTQTGNILCSCLESLEITFINDASIARNLLIQVLYSFQVTFDTFIFFTDIKTRSSVSAVDLCTFLLISLSDCVYALKLLEKKNFTSILSQSEHFKCIFSSNNWKINISKQIEVLSGHISETPFIMHRIIFNAVRNTYQSKMKRNPWWIQYQGNLFEQERFCMSSIDEVLNSFTDIVQHIFDEINLLSAITSATASSLLSVLQVIRKSISHKKIQAVKDVLLLFLKWLDVLSIDECYREELTGAKCMQKVSCIIHLLELLSTSSSLKTKYFHRTRNKISPSLDVGLEERIILTEEEQIYWRTNHQRSYFPCS